jgi:predicted Fe-Mo cluster-binding NifX family protein
MDEHDVVVCIPVAGDGTVEHRWGRAPHVAVARVRAGEIVEWAEHAVRWDVLHDTGTEGSHHARVIRFLRENDVTAVVASHMGPPMVTSITKLGLDLHLGATGDARQAVLDAVSH